MRTEKEVLKDFRKLGYKITKSKSKYAHFIYLKQHLYSINGIKVSKFININLIQKQYKCFNDFYKYEENITMQEHKLLTDLFKIWGWL